MGHRVSPVALDLRAELLDVARLAAGVALLLAGLFTVAGHVAGPAAGVAQLLPLFSGLLAVPDNVTTPAAVVAR